MAGITKQKYDEIQEAAMKLVASYGIKKLDAIENRTAWKAINRGFCYQLVVEFEIALQTARQHVAKSMRRQRFPGWSPPSEWGGSREGAGRK